VGGPHEHDNEFSFSMKVLDFLHLLSDCYLFKDVVL
jgi:hypothetical protein